MLADNGHCSTWKFILPKQSKTPWLWKLVPVQQSYTRLCFHGSEILQNDVCTCQMRSSPGLAQHKLFDPKVLFPCKARERAKEDLYFLTPWIKKERKFQSNFSKKSSFWVVLARSTCHGENWGAHESRNIKVLENSLWGWMVPWKRLYSFTCMSYPFFWATNHICAFHIVTWWKRHLI